ncbi:MAG TPA: TetR/AcrR family transcriptional regulator [Pyrinomonadaceae bacterium]|nr:TetR/AcrR family transcriptional regulator [Pyrinomonadaceae bacterium]
MIEDFFKCEHAGRMPGDKRREQILQTAFDLFSQRGFSGTTTKDIARGSGVSEAMVFKHFSSKDELYGAILEAKKCADGLHEFPWESNQELLKAMEARDDRGVFYHFALQALNKHQSDVAFMRLLFYSALEEHELAERFFGEFVAEIYKFLGSYIEKRQADGRFRRIDARIIVRCFLGMLIHHSLNNILWDKKRRILDISNEEAARNFAEIILVGAALENDPAASAGAEEIS